MQGFYKFDQKTNTAIIIAKINPSSKKQAISAVKTHENIVQFKIHVRAAPENNKANEEVINLLSKNWHINKKDIEIIKGSKDKFKIIQLKNITETSLKGIFRHYINDNE